MKFSSPVFFKKIGKTLLQQINEFYSLAAAGQPGFLNPFSCSAC
jgi:hypothetical protein